MSRCRAVIGHLAAGGAEVDGGGEEVEGGGVLLHAEVHQAQVVQDLPVEGGEVGCPLEAADGRHVSAVSAGQHELAPAVTYFAFPKKHIPMLFHRGGDSGMVWVATLYLASATSKSWWVCNNIDNRHVIQHRQTDTCGHAPHLHHGSCCQDSAGVLGVKRQCGAQTLERCLVIAWRH